jgi:D-beta-D-heptose 7-phosphate kinase/D-beta-D-heptose 1-phosphate adenosyltransferase
MLAYAKTLGQRLIVGLDTDKRVKANKGDSRPINPLALRIKVMESIRYVDQVVSA